MNDGAIRDLGETLARYSQLPYERAWSMPRAFYTDPRVLTLEAESLFLREWICIGREEEVAKPGDYFVFRIWKESVVTMRGKDGKLRAFSNVCRHRGALIASGSGNRNVLLCPYHNWSYDTLGRLVATPGIDKRDDFDRADCRLPEFACTVWKGFIFVCLDDNPPPLAPMLTELETLVAPYHMEEMKLRYLADEIWPVNWKCLVENFMEGYHLTPLHRETLHPVNPSRLCSHFPPGEAYFGYNAGFDPSLPRSQGGHPDLTDAEAASCVMYAIPPGLVVGCAGDYSSFLCVQPDSIDRVRVKMGLVFFGADWPQERIDWAIDLFQRTMGEDKEVLIGLMQGLNSRHQRPGPLARADLEGPTWDFYKYLNRRLGTALRAVSDQGGSAP